jgi:membrane protein implicated in regulation of membrane protease activity
MESVIEFFNGNGLLTTFWYIAIPSTILFSLIMVGSFFGFGDDTDGLDADTDFDNIDDIDGGFPIFTFRNFLAFFTFFAWGGIVSLDAGATPGWSIVIGTLSGLVMVGIIISMFFVFNKLRSDNTGKLSDTIGTDGTIHLSIPENGMGKVHVLIKGSHRTEDAISVEIKTGSRVKVTGTSGTNLIVEKV